ncbi:hypothetical protein B0A49_03128 [Cryomyces minteri]|uniref:Trafficking protein particle complex subunit n=1 Tax=Cryomyces minteri TaxID=331657 RepID=A0A4V5NHG4_9PEZI|nr:hypothetical protein B0A49_03128 [Cryomyces minteri]
MLRKEQDRVVFTLLIINKAGGLIYNRAFDSSLAGLSSNDSLILAGTFHGVHAIARNLCPPSALPSSTLSSASSTSFTSNPSASASAPGTRATPATGIQVLETARFRLTCFQTVTGTKFLLFTSPEQPNVDAILRRVYELYADFVMKNPFYTTEMPVRCEKFDRGLVGFLVGAR